MSDRDALLAAIIAHPDEDTPRLVYADWLQENGDPKRAEFVRVQIELARLQAAEADLPASFGRVRSTGWPAYWNRPHDPPERIALLRREAELHHAHYGAWITRVPKYATVRLNSLRTFRRGFVGAVVLALGPFLKNPGALWEGHPVESIHLFWAEGKARAKLAKCRDLARLRELSLEPGGGSVPADGDLLAPYARCPHLCNLRSLDLFQMSLADSGAAVLGASEFLRPGARALSCTGLGPTALAGLLSSPFAARLRRLEPYDLTAWGAAVIAEAPLAGLRYLTLSGSGCGDAGVTALTRSRSLAQLLTLDMRGTRLTDAALEELAGWPGLAGVRALNLNANAQLTGTGVEALVRAPHFRPEHLELEGTGVGDAGARALAAWPGLANVVTLDLSQAQITDAGGLALAGSPHAGALRHLKLTGNALDGAAAERLRERFGTGFDIMP